MTDILYLEFNPCGSQETECDPTRVVACVPHFLKMYTFTLVRRCSELKH